MYRHILKQFFQTLLLLFISSSVLQSQVWEQIGTPPFNKHHSNGYGVNGKAYVFEGGRGNNDSNDVWEYSPDTDTWVRLGSHPGVERGFSIGDDWDGKYYFGFGAGDDGYLRDLWVFDPADTSYTQLPSCPCEPRSHPAFIAHNDKVFVGMGSLPANSDDWWEFDLTTQEWRQLPDMPGDRRHHPFQFTIGDDIYVGGGHVDNWMRYSPDIEAWTSINSFPAGRVAGSQFSYQNMGFVLGGDDAAHVNVPDNQFFMAYNADEDEWTNFPSISTGSRWANSSFVVNDEVYFFGGIDDQDSDDQRAYKMDLSFLACSPPRNLNAAEDETFANLFWESNSDSASDTLKWRKTGELLWNVIADAQTGQLVDGLDFCSDYEFQVVSLCDSMSSESPIEAFKTEGCCANPSLSFDDLSENSVTINWSASSMILEYEIRYREIGGDWVTQTLGANTLMLTDLPDCTEYEAQIKATCGSTPLDYGPIVSFWTKGCGACRDNDYCLPLEFIGGALNVERVRINGYTNDSGDNGGYGNFEMLGLDSLVIGSNFPLMIDPSATAAFVSAWLDFNGDGSFAQSEQIVAKENIFGLTIQTIQIPSTAVEGLTRLRVLAAGSTAACSQNSGATQPGEVEDYCIFLRSATSSTYDLTSNDFSVFPNPFDEAFSIQTAENDAKNYNIRLIDVLGKVVFEKHNHKLSEQINTQNLHTGIYFLVIENENGAGQVIKMVKENN